MSTVSFTIPDHIPPELVFEFDFIAEIDGVSDPFRAIEALERRNAPSFFYTPLYGGHWVARSYEAILKVFKEHENFRTFPVVFPPIEGPRRKIAPVEIDPPDHQKYRSVLGPLMTPAAAVRAEVQIRKAAVDLIDGFIADGGCDFVESFAYKLPTRLFLEFMGLPVDRLEEFVRWTQHMLAGTREQQATAGASLLAYIEEFVPKKLQSPQNDWTSILAQAKAPDGSTLFSPDELKDTCYALFLAGLDTVPATFAHSWRYLAEHPEVCCRLIEHPEMIADAVEELCRVHAVANTCRHARRDMEFLGVDLKEGDTILLMCSLANRDASQFTEANTVNFERETNVHLSFGAGVHRCVGSNIARTEMRIALSEWLKRIPTFQIKQGAQIHAIGGTNIALKSLPLTWQEPLRVGF
jgi:cytochrome P450